MAAGTRKPADGMVCTERNKRVQAGRTPLVDLYHFMEKKTGKEVSISLRGGGAIAGLGNKAPETSYKDPIVQGESRGAADLGDLV